MTELRKRAMKLYPRLQASDKKDAPKAIKKLDRALTCTVGVTQREDPRAMQLVHAADFAATILGN